MVARRSPAPSMAPQHKQLLMEGTAGIFADCDIWSSATLLLRPFSPLPVSQLQCAPPFGRSNLL